MNALLVKICSIILVVMLLIAAFLAGRFWPWERPVATRPVKAEVNPEHTAAEKATVLMKQQNHITAKGQAELPVHANLAQQVSQPPHTSTLAIVSQVMQNSTTSEPKNSPSNPMPSGTFHGLLPGDSVRVPLQGTVAAEVYNVRTGEKLGSGSRTLSGAATVAADSEKLKVDATFDDTVRIGVTVPEPAAKRFHLGAACKGDWRQTLEAGGYLQYDLVLHQGGRFNWLMPLRLECWPEGWRGSVGVEVEF